MIRPLLLFLLTLIVTTMATMYVQRDRILPLTATFIARHITGIDTLEIGAITADPIEREMTLTDIRLTRDQTIKTIRLTPDLITVTDATLHIQVTQERENWVAALTNTPVQQQIYPIQNSAVPVILPALVIRNVAVTADTPYGPINAQVNGQYGNGMWVGEIAANAISLRHAGTVINGLTATLTTTPDTDWTADYSIATLTQGQTPLTDLRGTVTHLTTAPHVTLRGVLNTEFAFDAVADMNRTGPVTAKIRLLNTDTDVGHVTLTTNWQKGDQATLDITNLSLRTLPTLTGWQGLQADGRLSGKFELTRATSGWRIESGRLQGGQDGFIAYTPDTYPGFLGGDDPRLSAVRDILKHLNIQDIAVTASGDLADQMRLGIALKGQNPDYSPRPVHLNLNFEGTMWPLAQSLLRPLSLIPNIKTEKDAAP